MIVWLNGPFGAGKTTLADSLRLRRPDLLLFDAEEIGFVVKATVPPAPGGDYQDLPIWRTLTIAALRAHYRQDIVVPMTLVRPEYLDELLGGARRIDNDLLHVSLHLDADLLRDRIERQAMHPDPVRNREIRQWRLAQVDRCLSARQDLPAETLVLDSGAHGPDALADMVLDRMNAASGPVCRSLAPPSG
ncbi:ATP-binding protein [Paracoccus sp. Z118]|uniref:AAA family ATPase n=1 Tax=Paracoccus sp. Z118 TaxID=2851017 RepID=UPI001C2B91C7|nr:AAA family ATPase [Paracoccus sp. Z118]MBV0893200.1 ATP-binding protein [Paracoccus sp. Z118]